MNSYFQHYCTGCGLCQSTGYTKLKYREDGFPYPENSSNGKILFEFTEI